MKTMIAVITNIPDEINTEHLDVYVASRLYRDDFISDIKVIVKDMPQELPTPYLFRQMLIADGLQNEDGSVSTYTDDYRDGWNECIDEILGDTK